MIVADVRRHLTRDDAALCVQLIGRGSAELLERAECALRDGGIDAVLDDPALPDALLESRQGTHASLALFTYVMVRRELRASGESDRVLADYVASVMVHFAIRDRAQRIGAADDEVYDSLAAIARDVECADARRSFLVRAHLGNYALWLSGVYPDFIERRRWRRGGPDLGYYEEMGARGFRLAADHRLAAQHGLSMLYSMAAERFVRLRVAMNRVSDRLFFPNHHSPDRLMRQVRDEFGIA